MKTIFTLLLLIAFSLVCFGAEDAEKQLPKAMEPIIAKLNSARAEAASKAIKELQKLQGDFTKKNDLENAMAVKNYIDTLQKSIADEGTGTGDLSKVVIGTWTRNLKNRSYTFNEDGTFTQNGVETNNGKWTITKDRVILTAIEGSVTTLTIKSATEMVGSMSDGAAVTFVRK